MALKDFDISKIKSWKYPETKLPQSFQANGGTVTGVRDKIEEKFIEPDLMNSKPSATTADDYVGKMGTPQSYQVNNRAGTGIVTGLQGIISNDLDALKSKSLIIKTYDEMIINEDGIFTSLSYMTENPTHGFRHIPIMLKDFGIGDLAAQPERFAPPQIGQHSSMTRGGIFTDAVTDDHINILLGTDQYPGPMGRFLANQTLLQSEAISKGNLLGVPSTFPIFNSVEFINNLVPGSRVYRHGLLPNPFGRPANYLDNYPKLGIGLDWVTIGPGGGLQIKAGDFAAADLDQDNKLGVLYDHFILSETKAGSGGWFSKNVVDPLKNSLTSLFKDPYPIIPSQNVVGSPSLKEGMNQVYYVDGTDEAVQYTDTQKSSYTHPAGKSGFLGALTDATEPKFKFFSKSKKTNFEVQVPLNEDRDKTLYAKNREEGLDGYEPFIETKMKKGVVPLAVGGKADLNIASSLEDQAVNRTLNISQTPTAGKGYDTLAYTALGADDKGNKVDPGGAASLRYEDSLRSPSEINQTLKAAFGGDGGSRTDWLEAESGPNADKMITQHKGARDHYQQKVYNIGRQGITSITEYPGLPVADDKKILYGAIHKSQQKSYKTDQVDKVNAIPYGHDGGEDALNAHTQAEKLDFVPLVFYDVYNKKTIAFRAILDDITDTITPDWEESQYIGRPKKSAIYKGVERKIAFNFEIFPKTKQEFPILLEKVNYLVGQCYPNLDTNLRQTGPMIRLTLGDIVHKQLGYITECTVTFPKASPWEIDPGLRFTKHIQVSIGFTHVGGYIPVSTGKHYGLPWLRGSKFDRNGPKFHDYPNRNSSEDQPFGAKNDYRQLFKDFGQSN